MIGREHRDQPPAALQPAYRGDLRIALAAREQRRRRIDRVGIDVQDLARAIGDHADAPRPIGTTTTLPRTWPLAGGSPSSARNDTSGSRLSRKVTTPRIAVSERATSATCCRQLNDLPHAIERQRIFLRTEVEAHERNPGALYRRPERRR